MIILKLFSIPRVWIKRGERSRDHRWLRPFIASPLCDIGFKGTVLSEKHRLEHEDPCPNYVVCVYKCVCVCVSPGRPRWQAGKGEGGPSGQEAVKESSGYEDQTAGRTVLKAAAATVLKVWVTPLDTRDTHTHTHTHTHSCIFAPQRTLGCRRACSCTSVSVPTHMQRRTCTHKRVHSVTHGLSQAPPLSPPPQPSRST